MSGTNRQSYQTLAWALFALGVLGPSAASAAKSQNVVTAIEVDESERGVEVRIIGTQEVTYTVFKLSEPPRLVIDLSSTDVTGVDRLIEVERGDVKAVLVTQFEDGAANVGRVMIVLERDTEYDVRAVGDSVVVSLGSGSTPVAPTQLAPPREAEPTVAPAPFVDDSAPPQEELPEAVIARRVDRLQGRKATGTRVKSVKTQVVGDLTVVYIRTDGQPAVIETLELIDPPRLAVDLHGITKAPKTARRSALHRSQSVKDVRIGRHADMVRIVIDGKGTRMVDYEVRRTPHGLAIRLTSTTPVRDALVAAPEPVQSSRSARARGRVRALTYARANDTGRVVLAIDNARSVKYEVTQPDPRTMVLTLTGATLDEELEQTFDASRFGGAVQAITAFSDHSAGDTVKVVATLSRPVKSRVVPMGGGLSWEFDLEGTGGRSDDILATTVSTVSTAGMSSEGAIHVASSAERQRRRYRGRKINLEFKEIDIHNVLRLVAEVSKRNIVVSDDVKGTITLRLKNVPWDQALDLILRSKGLGKEVMGNIIRIAPAERLAKEREDRVKEREARITLEPLKIRLISVNFALADQMADKIKDILTVRGKVTVDKRTNSLIVKDITEALVRAERLVRKLDTETPQVLIEARIVEASTSFSREAGIQWGGNVALAPAFGNPTGLVFPNTVRFGGAADDSSAPTEATSPDPNFVVNMPAPIGAGAGAGVGFIFGSAGGAVALNLRLSALEAEGLVKTISAPKITTLDNEKATISQGLSIPFSQVSAAGVNTTFINAKLSLEVTPHVTADGSILMSIAVANNQPNPGLTGANGQPSISKKEAKTTVMVKDGDTTVIGGIYTRQNSESISAVPILSKIPVLGWLFKKKSISDTRTELLVFITPRIVNRASSRPGG